MELSSSRISTGNQNLSRSSQSGQGQKIGSLSTYGKASHVKILTEGEVIKGEITDLRNNEIEVTLEDNTRVAAFIEDSSSLSIGDTSAFRVVNLENGSIVLKALKRTDTLVENETIRKALSEAKLPDNEKNQILVRELMEQSMPINRSSLQSMLKLSFLYPEAGLRTLVLMEKNQIPIKDENVAFFQSLYSGKHPLFSEIEQLSQMFPDFLNGLSETAALPLLGSRFLLALHTESASSGLSDNPLFYLASKEDQQTLSALVSNFQPFFSEEEFQRLGQEVETGVLHLSSMAASLLHAKKEAFSLDYENLLKNQPQKDSIVPEKETASFLRSLFSSFLKQADTENPKEESPDTSTGQEKELSSPLSDAKIPPFSQEEEQFLKEQLHELKIPCRLELFEHPLITSILEKYGEFSSENHFLSSFLTQEEQSGLLSALSGFPLSDEILIRIKNGTLPASLLFRQLSGLLPQAAPNQASGLFSHPVMQKILIEEFCSHFLLTPKQLSNGSLSSFYKGLVQKSSSFCSLLGHMLPKEQETELLKQESLLKQELSFLKTVHDSFQYIELPLRFPRQDQSADLYVYTRKQALLENPESISVLLHLAMEHLGDTNIRLSLSGNQVNADFSLASPESATLFSEHLSSLTSSLMEKGFLLSASFEEQSQEGTLLKEFFDQKERQNGQTRYTFDIRA